MNELKKIKAEYLLCEIGEIDDALIAEAQSYGNTRASRPRFMLIAATLVLAFTLVLGSTVISKLTSPESEGEDSVPVYYALDSLVSESDTQGYSFVSASEDLPYFDENAHVVWQFAGEEKYYVSDALSVTELSSVTSNIGVGESVGDESPSLECRVWILYGDGRVVTPYLKTSSGNVSTEVFDYEPEIIPSDKFVSCISDILS